MALRPVYRLWNVCNKRLTVDLFVSLFLTNISTSFQYQL